MVLKGLYVILLGIFLALFIGVGINTFYPQPTYQTPASCIAPMGKVVPSATESALQQTACDKEQQSMQNRMNTYAQVVATLALIAAVIYFAISFLVFKKQPIFSYGFLFGSMFTLLYSLMRGLGSNRAMFTFLIVVISLILVMAIGYLRFIKMDSKK